MAGSLLGFGLGFGFGLCLYGGVAAPVVGGVQELALRLGQGEELACAGGGEGEDLERARLRGCGG